ncbi:peptidylprolyl isomerase [Flavobacterium lacus]|uniref:Periplasmic chaperone for outer membrane proteins SurA n=1 Tax=Flavobacterium lacus TaxID=1353778 RepID=A0A328X748_9FLAO|nr:peptidylprolyl isomerase [Flavobacterium lacus]RAR51119.1 periplasmic chaperone for outer membrane proteins SurA [Flavobacterium lacus]
MKFINKIAIAFILLVSFAFSSFAQELIVEATPAKKDSVQPFKRKKIDGIVATVGEYIILDSDIDMEYVELSSQGISVENVSRCELMGKLMEDRLYAHQALQDSTIVVKDSEINNMMEERIAYMLGQIGSMEKMLKFYNKKSEEDFKSFFFDVLKQNKLSTEMRNKVVEEVEITPEEVRTYFRKIPKEDLPTFGAEMEVSQIVIKPKMSEVEKQKVIDKLNEIRNDVLVNGSSFRTRAVLYSEDPGSRSSGGFYKMNRKTQFVKEFKEVAFSLNEGEISKPFETEFGYHIILVEKIRGQEVDLRHILLTPKVTDEALKEAKDRAQLIRQRIMDGELTFADAARSMSDEKETKANGGILLNPKTMDSRFELTKMDPTLYGQVSNLKEKEVSVPILDEDPTGKKSYKLLMVTNRIDSHTADYATDYIKIKELALKEKQFEAIGKWSNEKILETYIKINGEYRNCQFMNNWLKK